MYILENYKEWLIKRFLIERKKFDRSGVYAYTQRAMAYNSNKIEGSTLTPEQTASLFDTERYRKVMIIIGPKMWRR